MRDDSSRRVGPYTLVEQLGSGGMGVVYRGRDESDGREVAVKTVILPRQGQLTSLRREIRALARIRHPGIVRILDEGVQDGVPWYAMELVDGTPLSEVIHGHGGTTGARPTLPLSEAGDADYAEEGVGSPSVALTVALARRLCDPLAFLHGEGVVHRDLKPDNIIVRPDGRPVVVDFGLIRQVGGAVSRDTLEFEVELAGTVPYMAPEQIRGGVLDARCDLYSFGCILFEMLVGRPPFVAERGADVLRMHLERAAERPSECGARLPAALDDLVMRLLEKDPRRRLGHAMDVARVLTGLGAPADTGDAVPPARDYLYRPALKGREAVMTSLEDALERLRDGAGAMLLIGGEIGVGKTRLMSELAAAAAGRGIQVLASSCASAQPGKGDAARPPLQAFRSVLLTVADRCRERGPAEQARLLGDRAPLLVPYQPALADLPGSGAAGPGTADSARPAVAAAIVETLRQLVVDGPTTIIVDDLHESDELTCDALRLLARGGDLERLPLMVVGTYRTDESWVGLDELRALPGIDPIQLGRLDEPSIEAMVEDMLAASPAPAALVRLLTAESNGNPFFIAEYLRTAVEEGVLHRDPQGQWRLTAGTRLQMRGALSVPDTVREIVGRRIGTLAPRHRRIAAIAALLGREATEDAIALVAEQGDMEVMEGLRELLVRHLVEEAAPRTWRFVHDQVRRIAYASIPEGELPALHRLAAEAITSRGASGDLARQASLGHHWEMAGVEERARECYLTAAQEAEDRYASGEAIRLYRACLETGSTEPGDSKVRARMAALLLQAFGRSSEAAQEYARALGEARAAGDEGAMADCLDGLANVAWVMGRLTDARKRYRDALEIHRRRGDELAAAAVLGHLAVVAQQQGKAAEARELYEETLKCCRAAGKHGSEANSLVNLGNLHREQGDIAEARACYERALELHRGIGNARGEAAALVNMGELAVELGALDEARDLCETARSIYRRVSNRRAEGYSLLLAVALDMVTERYPRAAARAEDVLVIAREVGDRHLEGTALSSMALAAHRLGDQDRARRLQDDAYLLHRQNGDRAGMATAARVRAIIARRQMGDLVAAASHAGESLDIASSVGHKHEVALCHCELGHIALARGVEATKHLAAAEGVRAALGAGPRAELTRRVERLRAAMQAAARGMRLERGELSDRPRAGRWSADA